MPKRNIGWRWHLASFPEITAWQLEVNKSWSCEKLFPSLLPSLLLSSLQRQTPQHVFHILASQFIESLSGRCLSSQAGPTTLGGPGRAGGGARGGDGGCGSPRGRSVRPRPARQHRHQNPAPSPAKTSSLQFLRSRCCDKKSCGNRNETPSDPVIIDR